MEEMDDFGDLYADIGVDVKPASTVSNVCCSYGRKALEDDFVHGVSSHCNGDDTGLNEESILYGKIGGVDVFGGSRTVEEVTEPLYVENGDRKPSREGAEYEEGNTCYGGTIATEQTATAEREDDRLTDCGVGSVRNQKSEETDASSLSQYSDSEDDLHIVLNEDDGCYLHPTSMFRSSRPKGVASDDGDEDDDLVIVMGVEMQDRDQKWVQETQSLAGINDSGAERHRMSKNGGSCGGLRQYQNSQYSQYKYVRQRAAGFANKHSAPQGQVGHGDTKNSYCRSGSGVPSFCEFFLPRNKTIFDVGIDSLEKKPWRCPGVDITDFFNFGLDEESWKNYCMSLAQYREQVTMRLKIPVYGSVTGSADSEAVRGEFSTLNKEERILSMRVAAEGNAKWTEIPKGRAIQVEDSTGERLPSMNVRRPRVRDSDVVIQVILQEEVEASQGTHEENVRPSDGSVQNKSAGKKAYEMESKRLGCIHNCSHLNPASSVPECPQDTRLFSMPSIPVCGRSQCSTFSSKRSGISHLERYSGEDSAHNDDHSDKQSESHTSANNRKRDAPKGAKKSHGRRGDISSKSEHSPSQAESVFSDQTSDGSRDGHVERHSSFENGSYTDVEKATSSRKQHCISTPDQLDERPSSSQDGHSIEYKNRISNIKSVRSRALLKLNQEGKPKCDRRSMRQSRERSKMTMEDGVSFSRDNSKDEIAIHSEIMEGKVDFYSPYEKRNTVYYEAEESNKHRRKLFEGCRRGNDFSEDIYNEKDRRSLDVGAEKNIAIRHYHYRENLLGRKKHREAWFLSRGTKISHGRCLIPDEECDRSGVEHLSADNKKHRYKYLKYESEIRMGMGTDLNDVISRKSHKQEMIREGYKDYMPYPDQVVEINGAKERYGRDMISNMRKSLRGWERDEITRMYPCKRDLYSSDQQHHSTVRSKIISENPSIEDTQHIDREKERIRERYWQPDSRDFCYRKHQCEGLLSHGMAEHCRSSKLKSLAAANDWDDIREDSRFSLGSFFSENARNGWLSKNIYNTDDESSSECWHQDNRHGLCSCYSHLDATIENKDVKQYALDGENVLRFGRLLSNNGRLWESDVDLQFNSFSDVGDESKNYGSTPLSCRESVKSQTNVWEAKLYRRYPRIGNLRRLSSEKERRAVRELGEFCSDNKVSFWNSRPEDKDLSNVKSKIEKRLMHDTKNSCYRLKSVSLDKQHHREAEVTVRKDPTLDKYGKKEVMAVEKKEEASKVDACADVDQNNFGDKVLKKRHHEKGTGDNQSVPDEDSKRILEMLAKMEKRRERFKESVSIERESNRNLHHVFSVATENQESESREGKQRPIRKRRWCGS